MMKYTSCDGTNEALCERPNMSPSPAIVLPPPMKSPPAAPPPPSCNIYTSTCHNYRSQCSNMNCSFKKCNICMRLFSFNKGMH